MSLARETTQEHEEIEDSQDGDYESSSDGQRPGRFYGPDSSWRYYTQDERALAASLQQIDNNDLSRALYDVHALKAQARGPHSISAAKSWHSKRRWIQPNRNGKMPFQPPPKWTAWPLKPGNVPRSREVFGVPAAHPDVEANTYSKRESWKPSLHLQEELKAGLLRQAKDRFNQRQWEDDSEREPVFHSRDPSNNADDEQEDSLSEDAESELQNLSTPLFMADDDVASTILQPTVRHIISKQDNLLAALHKSRQGHRMDHSFTTRAKRKGPSRSGSPIRTGKATKSTRKRKRVVSDAIQSKSQTPEEREIVETSSKPARKPRGQYRRLPGQRDWSEIIGVAAMAGWDQSVIDRAARRCAAIFGESMSMRFMPETSSYHLPDTVIDYVPDMIPPIVTPLEMDMEDSIEETLHVCPHKSCRRHTEPYELRWRLREHLKKAHNYTAKELEDWKTQAIESSRRNTPIMIDTSDDEEDNDDVEAFVADAKSRQDGFLQPITVRIGRSKAKRPRASASRSRSRKAAVVRAPEEEVVGSGSPMSTDSEL